MLPLSRDPVCPCHLWILTALLVDSCEARDLRHVFLMSSLSLSLGILIFWHLFFLRLSSLDILFSPHPILLTRFCLEIVVRWDLLSWYVLCLEVISHSHVFLLDLFLLTISYLANKIHPVNYKNLHKVVPSITVLRTLKVAQRLHKLLRSQSLRKVLPSTTLYYRACTKYVPVLLCICTRLARKKTRFWRTFLKEFQKEKSPPPKRRKSTEKSHYRNLEAATPIRFTPFSCKNKVHHVWPSKWSQIIPSRMQNVWAVWNYKQWEPLRSSIDWPNQVAETN